MVLESAARLEDVLVDAPVLQVLVGRHGAAPGALAAGVQGAAAVQVQDLEERLPRGCVIFQSNLVD